MDRPTLILTVGIAASVGAAPLAEAPAAGGKVPLPRPRPLIEQPVTGPEGGVKARNRRAGPELARGRVPLPRPRPQRPLAVPAPQESAHILAHRAVGTDQRGQVVVSVDDIGRERDPETASDLTTAGEKPWPKHDIEASRQRCAIILTVINLAAEQKPPMGGPDGCGIAAPVEVTSFGAVAVKPAATLNCTMALATYKWITEVVQPAARAHFGEPVVAVHNAAAYHCRRRNNAAAGRISEHAFGNALDVSAFELASGKVVTVEDGWSTAGALFGMSSAASFLKAAHSGACGLFATVLGPRADAMHESHFHLDLGRGGRYKICD